MRVTVVIANRDYGDLVGGAIASVRGQDADLFLVDDGSQDDSADVIREALEDDATAEALLLECPVGPAAARNLAVRAAWDRTDLFAFLDSDDAFLPGRMAACVAAFAADPDVSLVYGDELIEDRVAGRTRVRYREPFAYDRHTTSDVIGSNYVVRKSALSRFGLFDESMPVAEVYDLSLRVSARSAVVHIANPLTRTRLTDRSLRRSSPPGLWRSALAYARGKKCPD